MTQGNYFDSYGNGIIVLGQYEAGNIVDVAINTSGQEVNLPEPIVYVENIGLLTECIEEMRPENVIVTKNSSSNLECDIKVLEYRIIMTSIPYDENWKVFVDGKEVPINEGFDMMLAVQVEAGEHHVEFIYIPKYFNFSAVVTIFSVIILLFVVLYNVRSNKKGACNEIQSV